MKVLILAGGQGTRLWPLSRKSRPKQLQPLFSEKSLLQETVTRAKLFAKPENIFVVVSNEFQLTEVRQQLPELLPAHVLQEPLSRNTAAAIAFGTAAIQALSQTSDETIVVLSADHVISNPDVLAKVIERGEAFLKVHPELLLTIGITPTYAETGYGYLERGQEIEEGIFTVNAFKEKPDFATAEKYFQEGNYLWNGGIFLWRTRTILDRLRHSNPLYGRIIDNIAEETPLLNAYKDAPALSIDYAVLETDHHLAVLPANLQWIDVGHWQAVRDSQQETKGANVVQGKHIGIDTNNTLIMSTTNRLIATAGLEDCIIVDTPDALLICRADRTQDVKKIVTLVEESGEETLT